MIQIAEGRWRDAMFALPETGERGTVTGSVIFCVIPDQTGVEVSGGQHGKNHDCAEKRYAGSGVDAAEHVKVHECADQPNDDHIKHRPIADEFHHPV